MSYSGGFRGIHFGGALGAFFIVTTLLGALCSTKDAIGLLKSEDGVHVVFFGSKSDTLRLQCRVEASAQPHTQFAISSSAVVCSRDTTNTMEKWGLSFAVRVDCFKDRNFCNVMLRGILLSLPRVDGSVPSKKSCRCVEPARNNLLICSQGEDDKRAQSFRCTSQPGRGCVSSIFVEDEQKITRVVSDPARQYCQSQMNVAKDGMLRIFG